MDQSAAICHLVKPVNLFGALEFLTRTMSESRRILRLILVAFSVVVCVDVDAAVHRIAVTKHTGQRIKMMREGKWPEYLRQLQVKQSIAARLNLRSDPAVVLHRVNSNDDLFYVSNITIGTPPQRFRVILDTGSTDMWITDSNCGRTEAATKQPCFRFCTLIGPLCEFACGKECCKEDEQSNDMCKGKNLFNAYASNTYKKLNGTWVIEYGTGSASGTYGEDVVRLGDDDGSQQLVIPKQAIGQALKISDQYKNDEIDGIVGLAYTKMDVVQIVPPLLNAWNQHLLDQPIFTVWLEHKGFESNVPGGMFTYGGFDDEHCEFSNDFVFHPLTSNEYWQFSMGQISVGHFYYSARGDYQAFSDTGTSAIAGPAWIIASIAKALGGKYDAKHGAFVSNCSGITKNIGLKIGGHNYEIEPLNFIVQVDEHTCWLALSQIDGAAFGGADFILGDPFIRQYCNVHDFYRKRIAFAKAKTPPKHGIN